MAADLYTVLLGSDAGFGPFRVESHFAGEDGCSEPSLDRASFAQSVVEMALGMQLAEEGRRRRRTKRASSPSDAGSGVAAACRGWRRRVEEVVKTSCQTEKVRKNCFSWPRSEDAFYSMLYTICSVLCT